MKQYDAVFWDLDGTLTDSKPGIINSIKYALDKMGVPYPVEEELNMFIGPPLLESYEKYCGLRGDDGWKALYLYREYFNEKGAFENSVYPGIPEALSRLKASGKCLIIATSKPEDFARIIAEHFGLAGYFTYIAGASMDETRTEKVDVIRYAMEECGLKDPEKIIMVGDRKHDVLGAKALGMDCIGVLYGYGSEEELKEAGAAALVRTPGEAADYILHS